MAGICVFLLIVALAASTMAWPHKKHKLAHYAKTNQNGQNGQNVPVRLLPQANGNCLSDEVECLTGEYAGDCILESYVCDNYNDCGDASDELVSSNCPVRTCNTSVEFPCEATNICTPRCYECDAWDDCGDYSDESDNCQSGPGPCCSWLFPCESGDQCIPLSWRCDNDPDCLDGSDEDSDTTCSGGKQLSKANDVSYKKKKYRTGYGGKQLKRVHAVPYKKEKSHNHFGGKPLSKANAVPYKKEKFRTVKQTLYDHLKLGRRHGKH